MSMESLGLIGLGFFSVGILLYAEYRKIFFLKAVSKTIAAFSFVVFGYLNSQDSLYSGWVFTGLLFSFWGDVFLIPKNSFSFLLGLVSFLLGHVFYAVAFWNLAVFTEQAIIFAIVPIALGSLFFFWARDKLGKFTIPVLLYLFAIHFMLISAIGMHANSNLDSRTGFALVGALLFYYSDFAVARERFVTKSFWNKSWGLPFYFMGQFLIAYSILFF